MTPSQPLGSDESLADPGLRGLCAAWEDVHRARLAAQQRGQEAIASQLLKVEQSLGRGVEKNLRAHPIWPWLEPKRGLRGVHVARLITTIGDPARFPGASHVWSYLGLRPGADGALLRRHRGESAAFDVQMRSTLLMETGLADQIILRRTEPYYSTYLATKERKLGETEDVTDGRRAEPTPSGGADRPGEPVLTYGLPRWRAHKIARIVAVKAFVADLWRALGEVAP